jgi:hypothetical protein
MRRRGIMRAKGREERKNEKKIIVKKRPQEQGTEE